MFLQLCQCFLQAAVECSQQQCIGCQTSDSCSHFWAVHVLQLRAPECFWENSPLGLIELFCCTDERICLDGHCGRQRRWRHTRHPRSGRLRDWQQYQVHPDCWARHHAVRAATFEVRSRVFQHAYRDLHLCRPRQEQYVNLLRGATCEIATPSQ